MTQRWAIMDSATGELLYPCFGTPSYGSHPKDNGFTEWDPATMTATRLAELPDPARISWDAGARSYAEDPAKVERLLVQDVKAAARAARGQVVTPEKDAIYSKKQVEVQVWRSLGATPEERLAGFLAMSDDDRGWLFLYACQEAARFGEPDPSAAIARFGAGAGAAEMLKAQVEAEEQFVVGAIRAAETAEAKREVAAQINWNPA